VAAVAVLLLSAQAAALDKDVIGDVNKPPPPRTLQGWDGTLTVGGNVALGHLYQVVGAQNGLSFAIGVNFAGELDYTDGPHDWRTTLGILEGYAYGPPINRMVKSADDIKFETTYYYHIPGAEWAGPFGRFTVNTVLFEGSDHRPGEVQYQITHIGGAKEDRLGDRLKLSSNFLPSTLKEGVGLFARPISEEAVEVEFRLGVGSRQVFADGQFVLAGVDAMKGKGTNGLVDLVRVTETENFQQAGGEAGIMVQGSGYDKKILYQAWAEAMMPFWRKAPAGDDRENWKMTNIEFGAKLSFKLVDWCSIDYVFKTLRQPQLSEDFQVSNNLLVTFAYTLPRRTVEEPAPAPAPAAEPAP
jgi:hypothetical protein